jgi:Outer membrane protein beta-barrel domain
MLSIVYRFFFTAAFVLLLQQASLLAQTGFGPVAGGTASRFSNSDLGDIRFKLSFHGGGFVNIPLKKQFSLQPELLYNRMGGLLSTDEKVRHRINMLQLPLAIQYKNKKSAFVETGPQFSLLLTRTITDGPNTIDLDTWFRRLDIAWMAGGGVFLKAFNGGGIGFRFTGSVLNNGVPAGIKIHHTAVQLRFFYRLEAGKN